MQTLGLTGALIVTTPQQVALADAIKGVGMFLDEHVQVPILGLVENMAWFTPAELPQNKYYIFGRDGGKELAEELGIPLLGQIPLIQSICECGDGGEPIATQRDSLMGIYFRTLARNVVEQIERRNAEQAPTQRVELQK